MLTILLFPLTVLSVAGSAQAYCTGDRDCYPFYDYCFAGACYQYVNYAPYYGIGGGLFGIFLIALFIWFLVRRQRINQQLQNAHNVNMARAIRGQPNFVYTMGPQVIVPQANPPPMVYNDPPPAYPTNGGYNRMG